MFFWSFTTSHLCLYSPLNFMVFRSKEHHVSQHMVWFSQDMVRVSQDMVMLSETLDIFDCPRQGWCSRDNESVHAMEHTAVAAWTSSPLHILCIDSICSTGQYCRGNSNTSVRTHRYFSVDEKFTSLSQYRQSVSKDHLNSFLLCSDWNVAMWYQWCLGALEDLIIATFSQERKKKLWWTFQVT